VRPQAAGRARAAARRGKVRLRAAGETGHRAVRALLSHEDSVRIRPRREPAGRQVDALPPVARGAGSRGRAAAEAHDARLRAELRLLQINFKTEVLSWSGTLSRIRFSA